MKTEPKQTVELFRAFEVEELESRLQNGFGGYYGGYGDPYEGCCIYGTKS